MSKGESDMRAWLGRVLTRLRCRLLVMANKGKKYVPCTASELGTRLMELGTARMDRSGLYPFVPVPISQASTWYSGE